MTRDSTGDGKSIDFDLLKFERLAAAGDPRGLAMLRQVLDIVEGHGDLAAPGSRDADSTGVDRPISRLSTAIATLFESRRLEPSLEDCDWLASHNRHLAAIFRMESADGPERVFRRSCAVHGDDARGMALRKLLAVSSIDGSPGLDWRAFLDRDPEAAVGFFLANFSHRVLVDAKAERRRNALFDLAPLLAGLPLRMSAVRVLSEAWMMCSYADKADRHELKRHLNTMVRGLLSRLAVRSIEAPVPRRRESRPTVVVVAEVMVADHAMYKTYAHFLRQLSNRFRLVLVSVAGRVDAAASALFDDTITPAWSPDIVEVIAGTINRLAPAMVYYPSVGMSLLTVVLCNLRLAPIQFASVGHPATTRAPTMDYMIMGHEYFADESCFSERVMLLRSGGALFVPESSATHIAPQVRERPEILRVAVPSSPMKLNASFLDLCRRVAERSGRAVEYWFFPNLLGLRYHDCRRQIEARLGNAVVFPHFDFGRYLDRINQCDVRFGTYPFGGANTSVDGFRQALPSVVFEGPEPHSRTDKRFIHLFGLPEWLIVHDEEEYERAALRLIRDDDERCALAHGIVESDPETVIFAREQDLFPTDFVDTVWWLYENHEWVQDSDKRSWTWEDRASLVAG